MRFTAPDVSTMRLSRSALYLPASNTRAIEKARTLDCDAVILDLEDAVERKEEARANAVAAVRAGGFDRRQVVVRVNAVDDATGRADLAALASVPVDAILLPKVNGPAVLHDARSALGSGAALWAMIETPAAMLNIGAIAAAATDAGLAALVAGTNDLAKDMRCRPGDGREPLLAALSIMVIAARSANLAVLDGVCNALEDAVRLERECAQARALGFDGKTLIHPAQIAAANRAFLPEDAEVDWARSVVAAFRAPENADRGAIRVEGAMVERLHLAEAERIMALARSAGKTP
jgi:citrate lyase subunit beta/citryl-CoA lyase